MSVQMNKYLEIVRGLLGTHDQGPGSTTFDAEEQVKRTVRRTVHWHKHAQDAAGTTATGETPFFVANTKCKVIAANILPTAALTANDTNYASILLKKEDGAGGGAGTLSTLLTKITGGTGDWAAKVTEAMTLTAAQVELDDGDILMVEITKAAAGVQLDIFHLVVEIEERA